MEISLLEPSPPQLKEDEPQPGAEPMSPVLSETEKPGDFKPSLPPEQLTSLRPTSIPIQKRSDTKPKVASQYVSNRSTARVTQVGYRSSPSPIYPDEARRSHQQGVVLLNVEVSSDGRPQEVILKKSSSFRSLDDAAIQAVHRWTFIPAYDGGVPIKSRVDVPVKFSIENLK